MMFFQDGEFPKIAEFIRGPLRELHANKPRVYKAVVECIGDKKIADQGLSAGTYPRVFVSKIVEPKTGKETRLYGGMFKGECKPTDENYIYVNKYWVEWLENDPEHAPIVERTILHELVHWGRFHAGLDPEMDGKEAGNWFEHRAYPSIDYKYHPPRDCE